MMTEAEKEAAFQSEQAAKQAGIGGADLQEALRAGTSLASGIAGLFGGKKSDPKPAKQKSSFSPLAIGGLVLGIVLLGVLIVVSGRRANP